MEEMFYLVIKNDVIMKLGFAALAGLVIGLESYESAFLYSKEYSRPMDPGRIPSYVISGIGFLGAGVILRRGNEAISGLTTAALVLASAGIGITIGAGFYIEALLGVIFIIIGVKIIPALFERIGPKKLKEKEIRVKLYIEKCTDLTTLMKEIKSKKLGIKRVRVKEEADDILINCVITTTRSMYTTDVYYTMKSLIGVIAAEVESGE